MTAPAILVLEDGRSFTGEAYGAHGETVGEAVFATGMTGYQETLTDPSYHRQVVVQTAPHIGNTGVNDEDAESRRIWVAGYVVRDPARRPSNWRSLRPLDDDLAAQGVVGISGIDTRALTRHLRERGAMRCGISSNTTDVGALLDRVRAAPPMLGADLSAEVSTPEPYRVDAIGQHRFTVAALDFGIKSMTPHRMAERGITTHVAARSTATADEVARHRGRRGLPGQRPRRPGHGRRGGRDRRANCCAARLRCSGSASATRSWAARSGSAPTSSATATGASTSRCRTARTGKVEITAHNHGFAVDAPTRAAAETPFGAVEVSHVCLNDGVVEGLRARDVRAFCVQYHPEAAAGPHDAAYLFDRFVELLESKGA